MYNDSGKLKVGGTVRYVVEGDNLTNTLYCRVRNTELSALRAAYLNGPFSLYVDMRPVDYSEYSKTPEGAKPVYNYHLKAGQSFSFDLPVLHSQQTWIITVQCEILFSRSAEVNFEITIGTTSHAAKLHGSQVKSRQVAHSPLRVKRLDTAEIWQTPLPRPNEPLHICVLTHGLVSNVTADMLYVKEALDQAARTSGENLICKGYTGNVCRTERGVKYLGRRLACWLINELIPTYKPAKLSFLAHSLGGLTQTYALGYIQATRPEVLADIELVNFITLASPMLGISAENPGYVQFALDFGVVGKSGRDLGLSWTPGKQRPLLERLPNENTLAVLRRFQHRTLYANAVNDGIVPLRTAALVFLDWYAIAKSNEAFKTGKHHRLRRQGSQPYGKEDEQRPEGSHGAPSTSRSSEASKAKEEDIRLPDQNQDHPAEALKSFLFERKQVRIMSHYQTVSDFDEGRTVGETLPHKTSLLESSISILLPPHPNSEYITDPSSRQDVIFHDRVYTEKDLPKKRYKKSLIGALSGKDDKVEVSRREERIARSYHSGLSWRKVLVNLLPEAHNNIIVRRRFSNAYGWPVVHHCIQEHFLPQDDEDGRHSEASMDLSEPVAAMHIDDMVGSSFGSADSMVEPRDSPWSESDDEKGPEVDHDPQRTTMLKIIRD